jgi:hypothetical protein
MRGVVVVEIETRDEPNDWQILSAFIGFLDRYFRNEISSIISRPKPIHPFPHENHSCQNQARIPLGAQSAGGRRRGRRRLRPVRLHQRRVAHGVELSEEATSRRRKKAWRIALISKVA